MFKSLKRMLICGFTVSSLPLIVPLRVISPDLMIFSLSNFICPSANIPAFTGILSARMLKLA